MTPGRALLCLRELKSLEYQGFSGKKKLHGNSIKITVQWWLRGKDSNQRPPGYELRSDPPLSPFRPICPSCARLSQSAWNHHSLRCSPALSAFGSRFGSGEFPGIQSLMTGAETVSKIAPQNNEESAVCLLKIELTFSFTRYKVTRKTSCF